MSDVRRVVRQNTPFAAQFEPDGGGYIYRKDYAGEAIRVSAAERDAFVAAFHRWLVVQILALIVGVVAVIFLVARSHFGRGSDPVLWLIIGTSAVTGLSVVGWQVCWDAPARALADRAAVAPPLTRAEGRRKTLANTSWTMVAFGAIWTVWIVVRGVTAVEPLEGWAWLEAAVSLLAASALAYSKWRLRQAEISSPPG
jgi:hypothetical protein